MMSCDVMGRADVLWVLYAVCGCVLCMVCAVCLLVHIQSERTFTDISA